MTNNKPWQTVMNTADTANSMIANNSFAVSKKPTSAVKASKDLPAVAFVMPKRYSFDTNGGGYRGL